LLFLSAMSNLARTALATLGLTVAASLATAAPLPGFTLAAQTARFSFYTRGAKVDAEKNERYLAKVEQLLGQRFDGRAEYYRYDNPQDVEAATGSYAEGVTFTREHQIHSAQGFHAHEIVHLVAGQLGDPGVMFQEGLAVVLGNDAKWNGASVDKLARLALKQAPALSLLAQFQTIDAQVAYPVAASFVHTLIEKHGLAKLSDFFRACPTPGDRDAAFEKTFGVTYAQAVSDWAQAI
jgi:hypothetical protein